MKVLSTSKVQQIEKRQITPDTEKFVRNNGSYKIANIVGKAKTASPEQSSGRKTALISGAGIAALAAAFELNAKGYDVVITEKRDDFSRFNIINLNREAQAFLRKFNLLEEFETSVAARINDHQIVLFGKGGTQSIATSDVSELKFEGCLNKNPMKFKDLFKEEGIYSVHIKDLQAFLAQKVVGLGVRILSESEIKIVNPIEREKVSKIEITQKNGSPPITLEPDLFFIAEGTHSTSIQQLEMVNDLDDVVNNACTGENWIFGNLNYHGDKTFVLSMIITSQKILQIANVIFNAKSQVVNVAVTSDGNLNQDEINRLILDTTQKAFNYEGITEVPKVLETVKQPVHITNRIASLCSRGNVFRIGDAVGHSSPLAGLGGTLGLTLVPYTVEQLLDDHLKGSDELHSNFKTYSQAYVKKWIDKSVSIKGVIQGIFEKDQSLVLELKGSPQSKEAGNAI
ncbi:MAG: FAD-dependent monooxygenase [Parachlamydiales bacterium]|jgi:2-polyprenyl-6-methoxyphenol hydroxylase-like FAD-dependent oxidoreductase